MTDQEYRVLRAGILSTVSLPTQPDVVTSPIEETQTSREITRDIRHAIFDALTSEGVEWTGLHDNAIDSPIERHIYPLVAQLQATRAALALRIAERERLRALVVAGVAGNFDKGEAERVLGEV